ncbi:MAG: glycosyltransferase, partial [Bacilli bacterium]|nr:glycosyltransferase [Bacilli bacterium]
MRIGIFTETYTPYISGLVTSVVMLKKSLEKMGHNVYVVTANLESYHYEYDEDEKVLKIPGIPTGIYDSRLTAIYPMKAINKIKSWDLDVIHSQTEFAIGTFARILGKQFNIPVVHTYHTMYEDYVHYITRGHFNKSSKKL